MSTGGPSSPHLRREEGRPLLLCPAAADRHLLKPHVAESPAWCQHHRTSGSSLVPGGTQTNGSPLSLPSWCCCALEANWPLTLPSWYWPQGVATAQGRVVCLRRSRQGVGRAKGHIGSWASDSRLAWVVHVWPAPGLPLPLPSPRHRLCPQRWSHGYPRRFDPEPAIKCVYLQCLGLVGSLARPCPSPTVSLCLSLSLVVGDCRA